MKYVVATMLAVLVQAVVATSLDSGAEVADASAALQRAYSIHTPEDSVNLYRDWASTYDDEFANKLGYVYAANVAQLLKDANCASAHWWQRLWRHCPKRDVLDLGAGTGLVAEHLAGSNVDGLDISAEMLEMATSKGLYRRTIVADLTKPLEISNSSYDAFISTGMFTHGHVGPGCLPELLRIARRGALFVLAVRDQVFDEYKFGSALALHVAAGEITPLDFSTVRIYDGIKVHPEMNATALVITFRKR